MTRNFDFGLLDIIAEIPERNDSTLWKKFRHLKELKEIGGTKRGYERSVSTLEGYYSFV
jgi:hypothetical protein